MWIFLNDCFLSIVAKDCARDELMVRARRPGDIEKLFEGVQVTEHAGTDYQYRARVKRDDIGRALIGELARVTYDNFKSSVADTPLHNAYLSVWTAMARLQPQKPIAAHNSRLFDFGEPAPPAKKPRKRKPR